VTHAVLCVAGLDGAEVEGALCGMLGSEAGALADAEPDGLAGAVAGGELAAGADDAVALGCGWAAAPAACTVHWTVTDLPGHLRAVVDALVRFPPFRQPCRITLWLDVPVTFAASARLLAPEWLLAATAYPPKAAAAISPAAAAIVAVFLEWR
jgi:hypothetical protein